MRHLLCLLGAHLIIAGHTAGADDKPTHGGLPAKEAAQGWIKLFDGETTFGWKIEGAAEVRNGALVIGGDKASNAMTITRFRSFELRFQYRDEGTGMSSVLELGEFERPLSTTWSQVRARYNPRNVAYEFKADNGSSRDGIGSLSARPQDTAIPICFSTKPGRKLSLTSVKLRPTGLYSIFAGKDLTGWKVFPGKKTEFGVNDKGELTMKNGRGDIQTEELWDDFVLQLDCLSKGPHLNSGVFFRALPNQFWAGYEAQIRNDWVSDVVLKDGTKLSGSLTLNGDEAALDVYTVSAIPTETGVRAKQVRPKQIKRFARSEIQSITEHRDIPIDYGTGAVYNRQAARKVVSTDHEWFTMTIAANGNHIGVWVNGYQTADFTDNRSPSDNARKGCKTDKGAISLQGHDPTTDLSFRNIKIATLPRAAKK